MIQSIVRITAKINLHKGTARYVKKLWSKWRYAVVSLSGATLSTLSNLIRSWKYGGMRGEGDRVLSLVIVTVQTDIWLETVSNL